MSNYKKDTSWKEPVFFDLSKKEDKNKLEQLKHEEKIWAIYDQIDLAVDELYDIEFPQKKDTKSREEVNDFAEKKYGGDKDVYGRWVFMPWSGSLVHFPPQEDLRSLRTSRNRNLVTSEEQKKLYDGTILVVGMSVGSNVAEALVSQGIGGKLILADMDTLEPSNLNRIRSPYYHIGLHKVDAIAQKISEIDPYIEQIHYKEGLNESSLTEIIQHHRPDVIVDEMDNVQMKLRLRYQARDARIPVIMAADDGDNILLDIERYDQKNDLPLLHGKVPQEVIDRILSDKPIPRPELGMLIGKYFVGFENTPLRMFESLREVGKTLPSWPQLGGAAALAGIILAYVTKKILLNQSINDGRFLIGPDEQLDPVIKTDQYQKTLQAIISQLEA